MKKTIIIFICVFMYNSINAQIIDTMFIKCQYKHKNTVQRINSTKEETDTMSLEIGKNVCKFYSYHNQIVDSLLRGYAPGEIPPYRKTASKYVIYTDYVKNKTTVVDNAKGTIKYFEYIEDFEIPKWTLYKETQTILSHPCRKAICRFRGRDYVAWYATDIPISRGPYKFAGLPGLILKIADTENLYSFECIGIEKLNKPIIKDKKEDIEVVSISREEFISIEKRFYANPKGVAESLFKSLGLQGTEQITDRFPNNAKLKYNPIELE